MFSATKSFVAHAISLRLVALEEATCSSFEYVAFFFFKMGSLSAVNLLFGA